MLLSICIPTYNRKKELNTLFRSVDYFGDDIEFVVCDDGSTDDTEWLVEDYSSRFSIKYIYQENHGRALALKNAIKNASGEFTMLMDSDDYFLPSALEVILSNLKEYSEEKCFLFGIEIKSEKGSLKNLPPDKVQSNFIALRADFGLKKDFKEVVKSSLLKCCLYEVSCGCRRVPTYLLWSRIAEGSDCLTFSTAVAVKEYLPGGMTDKILQLKTTCSIPMMELYELLSRSGRYNSNFYRWRSRLLWARYALHARKINLKNWWIPLVLPVAYCLYRFDQHKLNKQ